MCCCIALAVMTLSFVSSSVKHLRLNWEHLPKHIPVCRYRLRSEVDVDSVAEEFSCWQLYGGNLSKSSSPEDGCGWRWFKDPRLDSLGYRGIFPSNSKRKC